MPDWSTVLFGENLRVKQPGQALAAPRKKRGGRRGHPAAFFLSLGQMRARIPHEVYEYCCVSGQASGSSGICFRDPRHGAGLKPSRLVRASPLPIQEQALSEWIGVWFSGCRAR